MRCRTPLTRMPLVLSIGFLGPQLAGAAHRESDVQARQADVVHGDVGCCRLRAR